MCMVWKYVLAVLHGAEWVVLELTDLVYGLSGLPDDRPLVFDEINREYFALLDEEHQR